MEQRCRHCGQPFIPRKNVAHQQYCSTLDCQSARKSQWRKRKLLTDPDYRDNQYDAQKRWRDHNKDYWKAYRSSHPEYVERNRALQRERNHKRRGVPIAKSDELPTRNPMQSGYYRLIVVGREAIAKSDEYLVKLDVLSGTYARDPGNGLIADRSPDGHGDRPML
ncbi:MAG: hypothetical protein ACOC6B_04870 [Thermodesulfobacteriota bacterium]